MFVVFKESNDSVYAVPINNWLIDRENETTDVMFSETIEVVKEGFCFKCFRLRFENGKWYADQEDSIDEFSIEVEILEMSPDIRKYLDRVYP